MSLLSSAVSNNVARVVFNCGFLCRIVASVLLCFVCVSLSVVCLLLLLDASILNDAHPHTHIESLFSDCRERPAAIVINTHTISRQTERVKSQTSFDVGRCIVF